MNAEWNIRACAAACSACQRPFVDRETLSSRLRFTPEGYEREDFCAACWPQRHESEQEISAWAAQWLAPEQKAPEPLKKETAESLLRELMETDDPTKRNVIFILAVMLERRRVLTEKEVQIQPDGLKIRVYEHRQTGESFIVPDPQLRLREIEDVQREVMDLLGIPPPADQTAPPTEDGAKTGKTEIFEGKNAKTDKKGALNSEKMEKTEIFAENNVKMAQPAALAESDSPSEKPGSPAENYVKTKEKSANG